MRFLGMKKRILSLVLTMILSLSLSAPAFAEENKMPLESLTTTQSNISESVIIPMRSDFGIINTNGVRLRASAGLSGTVLGLLYYGTELEVAHMDIEADGIMWKYVIVLSTGQSGYVASQYITIDG